MPQKNRLLKNGILRGFAIAITGLSACTPAVEKRPTEHANMAPADTSSSTQIEETDTIEIEDKAAEAALSTRDEYERNRVLLIGPRPDRNPSLQDCGSLATQAEMNLCAKENYENVEEERDFIYQAWQEVLPDAGQTALSSAESAWSNFRELACSFERDQFAGGSIAPFIYNSCLTARTTARTDELHKPELAQNSYEYADGILNAHYQALQGILSESRRRELTDAQLAWIEYRDRHCAYEARYAQVDIQTDQCKARLTEDRTRQLQAATEQNSL